jgi:hypothetical protein
VVRATWSDEERPDIDRLIALGQCGQAIVTWTGSPPASIAEPPADVRDAAATWLAESALADPTPTGTGMRTGTAGAGNRTAKVAGAGAVR